MKHTVRSLAAQLGLLLAAIAAALAVRSYALEPYQVGSDSMWPTLLPGDHVFVAKLLYGAPLGAGSLRWPALREPERGEVVVFELARHGEALVSPDPAARHPRERLVRRVVGLPGDRVEGRGGALFVNGRLVPRSTGEEPGDETHPAGLEVGRERQGAREHRVALSPRGPAPDFAVRVPPDRYFLMSDNRALASDSRRFGPVRREDLVGPVVLLYWSWQREPGERAAGASAAHALPFARPRWSRIGRGVD